LAAEYTNSRTARLNSTTPTFRRSSTTSKPALVSRAAIALASLSVLGQRVGMFAFGIADNQCHASICYGVVNRNRAERYGADDGQRVKKQRIHFLFRTATVT
jgi:hypothetical protein